MRFALSLAVFAVVSLSVCCVGGAAKPRRYGPNDAVSFFAEQRVDVLKSLEAPIDRLHGFRKGNEYRVKVENVDLSDLRSDVPISLAAGRRLLDDKDSATEEEKSVEDRKDPGAGSKEERPEQEPKQIEEESRQEPEPKQPSGLAQVTEGQGEELNDDGDKNDDVKEKEKATNEKTGESTTKDRPEAENGQEEKQEWKSDEKEAEKLEQVQGTQQEQIREDKENEKRLNEESREESQSNAQLKDGEEEKGDAGHGGEEESKEWKEEEKIEIQNGGGEQKEEKVEQKEEKVEQKEEVVEEKEEKVEQKEEKVEQKEEKVEQKEEKVEQKTENEQEQKDEQREEESKEEKTEKVEGQEDLNHKWEEKQHRNEETKDEEQQKQESQTEDKKEKAAEEVKELQEVKDGGGELRHEEEELEEAKEEKQVTQEQEGRQAKEGEVERKEDKQEEEKKAEVKVEPQETVVEWKEELKEEKQPIDEHNDEDHLEDSKKNEGGKVETAEDQNAAAEGKKEVEIQQEQNIGVQGDLSKEDDEEKHQEVSTQGETEELAGEQVGSKPQEDVQNEDWKSNPIQEVNGKQEGGALDDGGVQGQGTWNEKQAKADSREAAEDKQDGEIGQDGETGKHNVDDSQGEQGRGESKDEVRLDSIDLVTSSQDEELTNVAVERLEGTDTDFSKQVTDSEGAGAENENLAELNADDNPEFLDELVGIVGKTEETVHTLNKILSPGVRRAADFSKRVIEKSHEQVVESFSPLVGREYAPLIASLISYGVLLLPLGLVVFLFERLRAALSLQKIILFMNVYLAAYFTTLLITTVVIKNEPMFLLFKYSPSSYTFLQVLQALGYTLYFVLQNIFLISMCTSEEFCRRFSALTQWVVASLIGLQYYILVFHRAMIKREPRITWKVYGVYSICFVVLCFLSTGKRGKREYVYIGDDATNKKN